MANEITVPLLPCRSIDEVVEFYTMRGLKRTSTKSNRTRIVAAGSEVVNRHFPGIPCFRP